MNNIILQKYINLLTKEHITQYAKSQNIDIKDNEVEIIYNYIKKYYKTLIYGDSTQIFKELKSKLSSDTYYKVLELYKISKEKIKKNS